MEAMLTNRQSRSLASLLLIVILILAGCAGSREATDDAPPDVEEEVVEEEMEINHAAYERFDAAPYREEDPEPMVLEHDVPQRLMAGRVGTSGTRTLDGFRIQLYQSQDPVQAEALVDQAAEWWFMQKQAGATGSLYRSESAPVYNVWRQPYYRVRLGDFASRGAAEAALEEVRRRFQGAFVVPDRVTITN